MSEKTLGQVLVEAILANPRGIPSIIDDETTWATCHGEGKEHAEQVAAAVVAAHEAAQLLTWHEAMAWATEGGARRYVLGYWEECKSWVRVSPETAYCRTRRQFTGAFTDDCRYTWSPGELTHFRKLPPAPSAKEGK